MKYLLLFLISGPFLCKAAIAPHEKRLIPFTIHAPVFSADTASPVLHSKTDFMQEYGRDDTSKALIRYYFFRGKGYRRFTWLPFVFAAPFAGAGVDLLSQEPYQDVRAREGSNYKIVFGLMLIFGFLGVALVWSVMNAIRYRHFRRKLTTALRNYGTTGKVARRIAYSTLFRVALRGEPSGLPWKQPKPAPRAPRHRK